MNRIDMRLGDTPVKDWPEKNRANLYRFKNNMVTIGVADLPQSQDHNIPAYDL
ncbi:MAG: hypothetical protein KTR28_01275 [Micavibrio sp.]|nr:hypothetical protein [Micavibrio sp.]